ncbi:hypothetical protein EHI8A_050970 [Entamoeba histolytica HM-1:IMSS-B]|uniref:Uncharacterized protein n=6 Tax=Entamoeba histolytica TaxID=5759 RepID=C4M9G1_ENTH1|nr:hypothetical protein EHI_067550 [Entamoeba histolytica HM-1:IMSS]EMD48287.1 Hypothetical protein EHI5A_078960 [Entamoeba histolytica KU27]EMH76316.1 hypothetical protein EHI8A_050970 [Entamoeba histolytica HM-1:IMSS-B]EMS14344.1 hypothetical protein KM1_102510 [Entamoeba histolytica HM-3:IMSS]ENY64187.1 hypothetical protein EHI7A_051250 [Entamoeba histolytica HM-1:IMSS-A]GAT98305.1 hypothetical protein CL6EHI_067550 [Entamoeba histolytica]|eukprot:XP_657154.1 hypothetical protein EHI_067550 [Entamoeba histolytica HM-1:IMSS]
MSGKRPQQELLHHAKKPLYKPKDPAHPNLQTGKSINKRKLTLAPKPVSMPKLTLAANEVQNTLHKNVKVVGGHEVHIPSFLKKKQLQIQKSKSLHNSLKKSLQRKSKSSLKRKSLSLIKKSISLKEQNKKIVTVQPMESNPIDLNQPSQIEQVDLSQHSGFISNETPENKVGLNKLSCLDLSETDQNESHQIKLPVFTNFNATPINQDIQLSDEEKEEIKKQIAKRKRRSSLTPLDREAMRKERLSSGINSRELNLQKYRESFSKRKERASASMIENK